MGQSIIIVVVAAVAAVVIVVVDVVGPSFCCRCRRRFPHSFFLNVT